MTRATRYLGLLCLLVVIQPSLAPGVEADKAAEAFNALYGQDLKRAKATRDAADDLELATRLLAAAKEATRQPEFLGVLCEKAFELASAHPDGHPTAMKAMETLATAVPAKVTWCAEQVVKLLQKQFTAARGDDRAKAGEELIVALLALADLKADGGAPTEAVALLRRAEKVARAVKSNRLAEIDGRQKALASSLRAAREVANLKALLERSPQNAAAREKLVRLCLVDMDNPAEAARYVEGVTDKSLRKYAPAAAKGTKAAPELACKELGEWYRGLAGEAPPGAKAAMYTRARAYYERFLQVHTAEDLDRTQVSLALGKVVAALEKLASPSGDGFRPLFNGKDLAGWKADDTAKQHWQVQNGVIKYDDKGKDLWTEKSFADFILKVDWRLPVKGDSGIYLRGSSKAQINIWCNPLGSGDVIGYRTDKSQPIQVRKSCTPRKVADKPVGRWNTFIITMKGDRLSVRLNGQEIISNAWLRGIKPAGPIALQSFRGRIEFRNIMIRELKNPEAK